MDLHFLYRVLRSEEIEAGYILIPKAQGPFASDPRLGIDTRLPFVLGPTEKYAVRQHQWMQKGFPTRGISTTPHLDRVRLYATSHRVIVEIDRRRLERFRIRAYVVNEVLARFPEDISVPEDDEVILVCDIEGPFPREVISRVITLDQGPE